VPAGHGAGATGNYDGGTPVAPIVACSALKRSYRDLLRAAAPDVVFVHLSGSAATMPRGWTHGPTGSCPAPCSSPSWQPSKTLEPDEAHVLGDIALDPGALVEAVVLELRSRTGAAAA